MAGLDLGPDLSAPRVLAPGAALEVGERALLPEPERRHLRVRRVRDGDPVIVLDGQGTWAEGLLEGDTVLVGRVLHDVGEPSRRVTVLLAAAAQARIEWAIEKGTEAGAAAFHVFIASRSQREHVEALTRKGVRLRRIAAEAVKQCGRSRVPRVVLPTAFGRSLGEVAGRLVLLEAGAPLTFSQPSSEVTMVVGPEGGLTVEETRLLTDRGTALLGLGPRFLRLETAVVAGLVVLLGGE